MTRTLVLVAIISFGLAVACFAATLVIVGGPFSIDDGWRFHRETWGMETVQRTTPTSLNRPSPSATGEGDREAAG